jgi:hypothetical protein
MCVSLTSVLACNFNKLGEAGCLLRHGDISLAIELNQPTNLFPSEEVDVSEELVRSRSLL